MCSRGVNIILCIYVCYIFYIYICIHYYICTHTVYLLIQTCHDIILQAMAEAKASGTGASGLCVDDKAVAASLGLRAFLGAPTHTLW